jgi:hypothetical protein
MSCWRGGASELGSGAGSSSGHGVSWGRSARTWAGDTPSDVQHPGRELENDCGGRPGRSGEESSWAAWAIGRGVELGGLGDRERRRAERSLAVFEF